MKPMSRPLIYYVAVTADGFIAKPDGAFDCFLFEGEHFSDLFARFPETIPTHLRAPLGITAGPQLFDTVLMGRATYEVGVREGVTSPYGHLRQILVSSSTTQPPDPAIELWQSDPLARLRELKQQPGRAIWLCGGSKLAATLAPEIDELILKVNPVLIGQGIPLFAGPVATRKLQLAECKPYPNGFTLMHYRA